MKVISLRLEDKLHAFAVVQAKDEGRSLNSLIEIALRFYLNERDAPKELNADFNALYNRVNQPVIGPPPKRDVPFERKAAAFFDEPVEMERVKEDFE
jgi:hypothetical protein